MDSCQHACIRTVYIQVVLVKISALLFDHREHVLAYMLGDLEALLGRDLGLPHLLHDLASPCFSSGSRGRTCLPVGEECGIHTGANLFAATVVPASTNVFAPGAPLARRTRATRRRPVCAGDRFARDHPARPCPQALALKEADDLDAAILAVHPS